MRKDEARRAIMTPIEEPDQLSYDDLREREARLNERCLPIVFAYDTMLVDV